MTRKSLALIIFYSIVPRAFAALEPPVRVTARDSSTVSYERGVEFTRLTEHASTRQRLRHDLQWVATAHWKTEWQSLESETHRIRQDGRWYTGLERRISSPFTIWAAGSGEHFEDRPTGSAAPAPTFLDSASPSPQLGTQEVVFSPASANSVHILRGGGGVTSTLWRPLTLNAGAGAVQDRRMGHVEGGLGLWTRADVNHLVASGYDQTFSFEYNRETPRRHENSDVIAHYENFREFFPGNANRAQASASILARDVYLSASSQLTRRTETEYSARDDLSYDLRKNVRVEMGGELIRKSTDQEQVGGETSSLTENQAAFLTEIAAGGEKSNARISIGLRSVRQTIRGEILQGKKGEMTAEGRTVLPFSSKISVRLGVSKYSLDTPNPLNYDDRDELRYSAEASWTKPLFHSLMYELQGIARLDHLVYLFSQSSANNRWSRLFRLDSDLRHRATDWFSQTLSVSLSANYQDYDYDTDPRTARSTVFRRIVFGDTISIRLTTRLSVNSHVGYGIEEFGRLFWDSFQEERSDETRSSNAMAEVSCRLAKSLRAGAGGLWDQRKGKRFPDSKRAAEDIFLNLKSYGPSASLEYRPAKGFFLSVHARVLRQLQLDRKDRWLTLGDAVGGIQW
jgi:hypothetical protein